MIIIGGFKHTTCIVATDYQNQMPKENFSGTGQETKKDLCISCSDRSRQDGDAINRINNSINSQLNQ